MLLCFLVIGELRVFVVVFVFIVLLVGDLLNKNVVVVIVVVVGDG